MLFAKWQPSYLGHRVLNVWNAMLDLKTGLTFWSPEESQVLLLEVSHPRLQGMLHHNIEKNLVYHKISNMGCMKSQT